MARRGAPSGMLADPVLFAANRHLCCGFSRSSGRAFGAPLRATYWTIGVFLLNLYGRMARRGAPSGTPADSVSSAVNRHLCCSFSRPSGRAFGAPLRATLWFIGVFLLNMYGRIGRRGAPSGTPAKPVSSAVNRRFCCSFSRNSGRAFGVPLRATLWFIGASRLNLYGRMARMGAPCRAVELKLACDVGGEISSASPTGGEAPWQMEVASIYFTTVRPFLM